MSTIKACVLVNSIFKSNLSDSDIKKIESHFVVDVIKSKSQLNNLIDYKYLINFKDSSLKIPLIFEEDIVKIVDIYNILTFCNNGLFVLNNDYYFLMLYLINLEDSITHENITQDIAYDIIFNNFIDNYKLRQICNMNTVFYDKNKNIFIILCVEGNPSKYDVYLKIFYQDKQNKVFKELMK